MGNVAAIQGRNGQPRPAGRTLPREESALPGRVRILIADDQPETRETLATLVRGDPHLELAGVAVDAGDAVEVARQTRPDVALVDVSMPGGGGIRAAEEIMWRSPLTHVVAFSIHDDRASIVEMLRAGASGYVIKGASCEEILEALHRAARGRTHFPPDVILPARRHPGARRREAPPVRMTPCWGKPLPAG